MSYQPHSLLVTGGAGFIGSNFLRALLEHHPDVQVVNLDSLSYAGSTQNLKGLDGHRNYRFVRGDICDGPRVRSLLEEHQVDTIVHLAAESHVDRSIAGPAQFVQTNIVGTSTLLEEALHYWKKSDRLSPISQRFHRRSVRRAGQRRPALS